MPRFVWAARFGPGKVGNGSCSYQDVIHSTTKAVRYNIALLKELDFDIDAQTDPITLRSWAKMAARVNLSLWNYRSEFGNGLITEGHIVTTITDDVFRLLPPSIQARYDEQLNEAGTKVVEQQIQADLQSGLLHLPNVECLEWQHDRTAAEQIIADIKTIQEHSRLAESQAIAGASDITPTEYDRLRDQRAKTVDERHVQQKYELQRRYPIPVTPELKLKDDEGWYARLRLHYYLIHSPELVKLRDLKEWQGHLDRGDGKVALQDVRLLTAQVETLKLLGILNLLDPERSIRATDSDVQQLSHLALQYSHDIKAVLHVTVTEKMKPIEIVQALLSKLGLKLTCVGRDVAPDGRRGGIRIYQYQPPDDERDIIFAQWQQRDMILQANQPETAGALSSTQLTIAPPSDKPSSLAAAPKTIAPFDPPPDICTPNESAAGSQTAGRIDHNNAAQASDKEENLMPAPQRESCQGVNQEIQNFQISEVAEREQSAQGSAVKRSQNVIELFRVEAAEEWGFEEDAIDD